VNVHPTKLEIRFEDEKKVYNSLLKAVETALQDKSLIPEFGGVELVTPKVDALDVLQSDSLETLRELVPTVEAKKQVNIHDFGIGLKQGVAPEPVMKDSSIHMPKMSLVGQILNTYIIAQSDENILIIDQHAAHERVLFERLMKIDLEDKKERQDLLSPLTIELTPTQMNYVTTNQDVLDSLGFKIDHFGGNTFQIRAVPVVLKDIENVKAIYDIIDELLSIGKTEHRQELMEKAMAIVACHSAIRGGEELSLLQMKNLVENLYNTKNAYSCPHGRPSILSMSKYELEKRFKRK
jgi:DNA mismatch repair protein MutL